MDKRAQKVRLSLVFIVFLVFLSAVLVRLFYVQVLNNDKYARLAEAQHLSTFILKPQRGWIYDRNKRVLAMSLKVSSVYAVPRDIPEDDKQRIAVELSRVLGLESEFILTRLSKDKAFVWIKRRISEEEHRELRELKLRGVGFIKENKRHYPNQELAAHIIGFAGVDEQGLEGLELFSQEYLKGVPGRRALLRDAKQRVLPGFEYDFVPPVDGHDLILTIDQTIQHYVERELSLAFSKNNAEGGSIVVMDPFTGEIFALANRPGFDPNRFAEAESSQRRNRAVTDYFEPGSTFKIITASAALNEGRVKLGEIFDCENGAYRVGGHTLHDHRPHGKMTFVEIIEKSSNIGTVKVAQKLGEELLYRYIRRFGFGTRTGIDLPGEVGGFIRPVSQWSRTSITALPMGHEITVTVVQMARAMAAIANGGYLVQPYVVSRVVDKQGELIEDKSPQVRERIIEAETALKMKGILKGVVEKGTGRNAAPKGYTAAGKTGTAQKISPEGGYSHSEFVASFIGFTPVENPRFVIAVVFDNPRPSYYGGTVCAPVFKNIAENILRYAEVPEEEVQIVPALPKEIED